MVHKGGHIRDLHAQKDAGQKGFRRNDKALQPVKRKGLCGHGQAARAPDPHGAHGHLRFFGHRFQPLHLQYAGYAAGKPFNTKVKKFILLQLIFENDAVNEGFGVYGAEVQYTVGNYVK